jgi:hypothetical protein
MKNIRSESLDLRFEHNEKRAIHYLRINSNGIYWIEDLSVSPPNHSHPQINAS